MGWAWCLGCGDVDGDGNPELIVGGKSGMSWYRLPGGGRGLAASLPGAETFHVGLTLEDIDGDGLPEVVAGVRGGRTGIMALKPGPDINRPWIQTWLADSLAQGAHDVCFADIDGDGRREMIANDFFPQPDEPGLVIYRPGPEGAGKLWIPHVVQTGCHEEGLVAADFDGDGKVEILSGTALYRQPPGGPYSGEWEKSVFAPDLREMCRLRLLDVTGNGRPDVIATDSEYMDGYLDWYENRPGCEGPQWIRHPIARGLVFSHSLDVRTDPATNEVCVFLAEMAQGGFGAPYNRNARLLEYRSGDKGKTWRRVFIDEGSGTHEARMILLGGRRAVVGKECWRPRVQLWREPVGPSPLRQFSHRFLDMDKPAASTNLLVADIDGDGQSEIVCGRWWYRGDYGTRREIPGIGQAIAAADIDGDGCAELIATLPKADAPDDYGRLSSELVWLKAVDAEEGVWKQFPVGTGRGDWPHGAVLAPLLPNGQWALVVAYHSAAAHNDHWPELFAVPAEPASGPWTSRVLAEVPLREQILARDLNGNGLPDLVSGCWFFENKGDGTFLTRPLMDPGEFEGSRLDVMDVNGNGRLDIIVGEHALDFENKVAPLARLAWLEHPAEPDGRWRRHIIDWMRCPHSVAVADLDGDGEPEIVAGEHDPFLPYRSQCRLYIYKKACADGSAWIRIPVDERFEHHCGCVVAELSPNRPAILSHGWQDNRYVHVWEAPQG